MKREIDLLKFYPKSKRPIEDRGNLDTEKPLNALCALNPFTKYC